LEQILRDTTKSGERQEIFLTLEVHSSQYYQVGRVSNNLDSALRSRVFGSSFEFVPVQASDFHTVSIYGHWGYLTDSPLMNPPSSPGIVEDSLFGLVAESLQTGFGLDHTAYAGPSTTMSNLFEFSSAFITMYHQTVDYLPGNSIIDRFSNVGLNPINLYNNFKRDTSVLPSWILKLIWRIHAQNLYSEAGQLIFVKFMQKFGYDV
jgi:hypothetical protein